MANTLYWYDEIEQLVVKAAHNDIIYFTYVKDTDYQFSDERPIIDKYFATVLLKEAEDKLYDNISKFNSIELSRYINNSFNQIISYFPTFRYTTLQNNFWLECFAPDEPNKVIDDFHIRFFEGYYKAYEKSYVQFEKFITPIYDDYKKGLLNANSKNNITPLIIPDENPKLKTNLSVPQLAYLFKLLNDLNPNIFELNAKTDLSDFIANNFVTKATEKNGISSKSVYNLFSNVDKDTANFWVDKLKKMLEQARKI
mgnify:CR=1 FL=1